MCLLLICLGESFVVFFYICVYACVCACVGYMWRSEDNLWKLVLFFLHVVPRHQTQVVRLPAGVCTCLVILPLLVICINTLEHYLFKFFVLHSNWALCHFD